MPVVQMIFDEVRIKSGVAFNASTGKESGFAASKNGKTMNFMEEIMSIADESLWDLGNPEESVNEAEGNQEKDEKNNVLVVPETHCNVFKLRTGRNQT